jgi:hypothetical protein
MKLWRVVGGSVALACLVAASLVLPVQAYQEKDGEVTFTWKGFDVEKKDSKEVSYFQKLETTTNQDMQVVDKGGQPVMKQMQKQTFIIQWTPKDKSGSDYVIEQQIVYVNMSIQIGTTQIGYDSDNSSQPKNPMTDFFNQLMTVKLTLVVDDKMKVKEVKNQKDFIDKLGESHPQMKNLLKSILGEQAIKTMSEQTWASIPVPPNNKKKKGDKWSSEADLSMPAIGLYKNKYEYTYDGLDDGKYKILVKPSMNYKPPTESPSKEDGLAFKIKGDSLLNSVEGKDTTGTVLFDPATGRIFSSTIKMKVTGNVVIEIGGSDTKVKLDQDQESKLTTGSTLESLKPSKKG